MRSVSQTNVRPLSMLVGNRTGLLSNSIINQSIPKLQPIQNHTLTNSLDISTPQSFFSIIQVVTKRFMKVNYKITRIKKKRKFGFLARNKTQTGRKILAAKKKKGRRLLTY